MALGSRSRVKRIRKIENDHLHHYILCNICMYQHRNWWPVASLHGCRLAMCVPMVQWCQFILSLCAQCSFILLLSFFLSFFRSYLSDADAERIHTVCVCVEAKRFHSRREMNVSFGEMETQASCFLFGCLPWISIGIVNFEAHSTSPRNFSRAHSKIF